MAWARLQQLLCLLIGQMSQSLAKPAQCKLSWTSCKTTAGKPHLVELSEAMQYSIAPLACAGKDGVGAMFAHMPEIMLCKPSNHDRWDRRLLQLAVFLYRHGHCNVPEASLHACALPRHDCMGTSATWHGAAGLAEIRACRPLHCAHCMMSQCSCKLRSSSAEHQLQTLREASCPGVPSGVAGQP